MCKRVPDPPQTPHRTADLLIETRASEHACQIPDFQVVRVASLTRPPDTVCNLKTVLPDDVQTRLDSIMGNSTDTCALQTRRQISRGSLTEASAACIEPVPESVPSPQS